MAGEGLDASVGVGASCDWLKSRRTTFCRKSLGTCALQRAINVESKGLKTLTATLCSDNDAGYYGSIKLRQEFKLLYNFWSGTFAFETFPARPLLGEESFVHETGRIRRRDRFLFIKQRQQASTPFTRHSETGQSDTKSTGNQAGDATSGTIRLQSKKGILGDTLCGINCGCRLSRHV